MDLLNLIHLVALEAAEKYETVVKKAAHLANTQRFPFSLWYSPNSSEALELGCVSSITSLAAFNFTVKQVRDVQNYKEGNDDRVLKYYETELSKQLVLLGQSELKVPHLTLKGIKVIHF